MPLIELHSYKAICDHCGKVGSTWQSLPEKDREKAIPDDWIWRAVEGLVRPQLICTDCIDAFSPPENDSRA